MGGRASLQPSRGYRFTATFTAPVLASGQASQRIVEIQQVLARAFEQRSGLRTLEGDRGPFGVMFVISGDQPGSLDDRLEIATERGHAFRRGHPVRREQFAELAIPVYGHPPKMPLAP